jgi:putative intracellular protease/amidase
MAILRRLSILMFLSGVFAMTVSAAESTPPPHNAQYTAERPLVVGMLLFEGFEMLDVFGPLEMFGDLGSRVRIVTVGLEAGLVKPRNGPAVQIEQTLASVEALDLFIIPGGIGTRKEVANPELITAIKTLSIQTPKVASVCTGAALLARTGLLDGLQATTNKKAFDWVSSQGPEVVWMEEGRWVDTGKFATSSGVSAGTDLALALIAQLFDRATAEQVARNTEYVWNDDPGNDPFARTATEAQ